MIIYSTIDMLTSFWVWLEPASAQVSNGVNDDKTTRWTGLPWFQTNSNTARSVFVQRCGHLPWTKYYNWFHHPKVLDCKQWTIWKVPLKIPMVFLAENPHGVLLKSPCLVRKSTVTSHRRGVYGIDLLKQMDAIIEEVKGKTHITKWLGLDFSEAWGLVSWAAS